LPEQGGALDVFTVL